MKFVILLVFISFSLLFSNTSFYHQQDAILDNEKISDNILIKKNNDDQDSQIKDAREQKSCKIDSYFENLKKVKELENSLNKKLPIIYNQMGLSGYLAMPSAKMNTEGTIAFSYSNSFPYKILGFNLQYFSRIEICANVWIFTKMLEGTFGKMGFGNDADRTANLKFLLLKKTDGFPYLPEIAFGMNDFLGSKRFHSNYLVMTKEFLKQNFECTLGYGWGRINGLFGGVAFYPFLDKSCPLYKEFSIFAEYDANDYKHHLMEHPKGKEIKYPINLGCNLQINDLVQTTISTLRGKNFSFNFAASYNLGESKGLYPKYLDKPICFDYSKYISYFDTKEIEKIFKDQGFEILEIAKNIDCKLEDNNDFEKKESTLFLKVMNLKYRSCKNVKLRIQNLLTYIPLDDFDKVVVYLKSDGVLLYKYIFDKKYILDFRDRKINSFALSSLSKIDDPDMICTHNQILYRNNKFAWILTIRPKVNAFFSSCRGKFKYDLGALATQEGFIFKDLYYNFQTSYVAKSSSAQVGSRDKLNPSQLLNVRSDFVKYFETNSFHVDSLYFQKNINIKKALYGKFSLGYLELAYAGLDLEFLYYPVNTFFACSIEGANVYKRKYSSLGFQKKIRKWRGFTPEYVDFVGYQYFLNLFLEVKSLDLMLKTSIGQFLARDTGVKFELYKYFKSGFEVSCWITFTNGNDRVNNQRYFDKGFSISIPLDIFMNKSSKVKTCFKMSQWLRDVGAKACTGKDLYSIIHNER